MLKCRIDSKKSNVPSLFHVVDMEEDTSNHFIPDIFSQVPAARAWYTVQRCLDLSISHKIISHVTLFTAVRERMKDLLLSNAAA